MSTKTKKAKSAKEETTKDDGLENVLGPDSGENSNEGADSETAEMETDIKGNTFLPGTAPKVIKPLVEQVYLIERTLKPDFAAARDALVAGQDELSRLAHENIQHFSPPNEKGERKYEVPYKGGTVTVAITFQKEKIVTKIEDEE